MPHKNHNFRCLRLLTTAIALNFSLPTFAAKPIAGEELPKEILTAKSFNLTSLSEEDFLLDIPVVLTATRLAQPINEAPAAITIIDREMIRASGSREIADLFRMVPGFVVSRDNGHTPIVAYHGFSSEYGSRMQVLVDGRSVYSPVFGGVDWANLPIIMDDIERIEIIRGPNAASFGSNSFLSIINIITQHASETTGAFGRWTNGSNGVKDVVVRIGETTGDFDYRVSASIMNDAGFVDRDDDRRLKTVRFRGDYQLSGKDNLMFQTGITQGIREIDSKFFQATVDRDININFEQIQWQRQIDNDDAISLQFFHTLEKIDQINDGRVQLFPLPLSDTRFIIDSSTQSERFDFELQHTKQLQENLRLVWGLGLRQDSAKGPHIFGTGPGTGYTGTKRYFYNQVARVFSNVEWRLRNTVTFNLGAMWEESDIASQEFSPRLGINFSITPEQYIRIIASRATRTPSLNESRSNFRTPVEDFPISPFGPTDLADFTTTTWVGNRNVSPEKITSYELAYHANFIRKKLSFDLKLFHEQVRGLITIDENRIPEPTDLLDGEILVYDNLTDANIRGVEANLDFTPLTNTRLILSRSLTDIDSKNPNVSSDILAESAPRHITSLLAINRFPGGVTGSMLFYSVSNSNGLGSGKPLPGYRHVNLRLAFPFGWTNVNGEIALVIQNASGDYLDWRKDNLAETQQYITISAQLD